MPKSRSALVAFGTAIAVLITMRFLPDALTNSIRLLPTSSTYSFSFEPTTARLFDARAFESATAPGCPNEPHPAFTCFLTETTLSRSQTFQFSPADTKKETRLTVRDIISADGRPVMDTTDTSELVRHSAFPVDDPVASAQTTSELPGFNRNYAGEIRTGLQYAFPFASEWRSYLYFDQFGHSSYPIDFQDREDHNGTTVYRFHQDLKTFKLNGFTAKGTASQYYTPHEMQQMGLRPSDAVSLDQFYSASRTVWVEPKTGTVLDIQEEPRSFLARNIEEATAMGAADERMLFRATFTLDAATKTKQRDLATQGVHRLKAIHLLVYLSHVVTTVLLLWGVYAVRRDK
ncbi:porin PorA family protein [Staphylococcus chromogenes]|nr:porin PorA family protein [Staphylococcus chromogenes]